MLGIPIYTVPQVRTVISDFREKIERSRIIIQHYESTIQLLGETPLRLRKIIEHETKVQIWLENVHTLKGLIERMIKGNRSIFQERKNHF